MYTPDSPIGVPVSAIQAHLRDEVLDRCLKKVLPDVKVRERGLHAEPLPSYPC